MFLDLAQKMDYVTNLRVNFSEDESFLKKFQNIDQIPEKKVEKNVVCTIYMAKD